MIPVETAIPKEDQRHFLIEKKYEKPALPKCLIYWFIVIVSINISAAYIYTNISKTEYRYGYNLSKTIYNYGRDLARIVEDQEYFSPTWRRLFTDKKVNDHHAIFLICFVTTLVSSFYFFRVFYIIRKFWIYQNFVTSSYIFFFLCIIAFGAATLFYFRFPLSSYSPNIYVHATVAWPIMFAIIVMAFGALAAVRR